MKKIYFLVVLFSAFIPHALSSPNGACSGTKEIKKELSRLSINPNIETNKQLLDSLDLLYGGYLVYTLINKHPEMENSPNKRFDLETIKWVEKSIWSTDHARTRFELFFGKDPSEEEMKMFAFLLFDLLWQQGTRVTPVFLDAIQAAKFNSYFTSNLKDLVPLYNPKLNREEQIELKKTVRRFYIDNKNFLIGLNKIKVISPVVSITGHGSPESDVIWNGDKSYTAYQLAEIVFQSGIKNDARIEIRACFSGCSKRKLNYTIHQIKTLFMQGQLQAIVSNGGDNMLSWFSQALRNKAPEYNGSVFGYLGALEYPESDNVFNRDGSTSLTGFAVSVIGLD